MLDIVSYLMGRSAGKNGVLIGITQQPQDVTAATGKRATFTVAAVGKNLTYQWQYSADGDNWSNSSYSSAKTATLFFSANASFNGYQYRCIVTSDGGTIASDAATLTVT